MSPKIAPFGVAPRLPWPEAMTAIFERPFDDLLREAVAFHGA